MITRLFFLLALAVSAIAAEPHVVIMIGEDEYKTWETLPVFAEKHLRQAGFRVTVVQEDAADKNNFPGIVAALKDADLLLVSVRRRTPVKEQLDAVRAHLAAGRALVGIRTASHAFAQRKPEPLDARLAAWQGFDPEVLGGNYAGHHGNGPKTALTTSPGAETHGILRGVDLAQFQGAGSLYKVSPLEKGTTPLLIGTIAGQPAEPVAWTNLHGPKKARIFYTSLGHPDDFANAEFRKLLLNGIRWALEK